MVIVTTQTALEKAPAIIHLLLTNRCNLNCPKCYYPRANELSLQTICKLFGEWHAKGVQAVAVGGGEPFLHPDIAEVIHEAKRCNFYLAVTTNGTILPKLDSLPDRVHVSSDALHPTTPRLVRKALDHFEKLGVSGVGINHVVTSASAAKDALKLTRGEVTLLLEKPRSSFTNWSELMRVISAHRDRVWLDACMAKLLTRLGYMDLKQPCRQGKCSMSLSSGLEASLCSNVPGVGKYTTLEEAWSAVRTQNRCLIDEATGMDGRANERSQH